MKMSLPSSLRGNTGEPSVPPPVAAPGIERSPATESATEPLWATEPTSATSAPPRRAR